MVVESKHNRFLDIDTLIYSVSDKHKQAVVNTQENHSPIRVYLHAKFLSSIHNIIIPNQNTIIKNEYLFYSMMYIKSWKNTQPGMELTLQVEEDSIADSLVS